jgi:2-iminobutanoate/2-iminopropanoate deaminase
MRRRAIRVEPISTYLERWNAPLSPVTRVGNMVYVSGLPPFDPETGTILPVPIERQTELIIAQMKLCLEAAGASMDSVMKCNIYCTSAKHFPVVNAIYATHFPVDPPARIFVCVPEWTGPFDIEIDCIAVAED